MGITDPSALELQHQIDKLKEKVEKLEKDSHKPYDFTDLLDRIDRLEDVAHEHEYDGVDIHKLKESKKMADPPPDDEVVSHRIKGLMDERFSLKQEVEKLREELAEAQIEKEYAWTACMEARKEREDVARRFSELHDRFTKLQNDIVKSLDDVRRIYRTTIVGEEPTNG